MCQLVCQRVGFNPKPRRTRVDLLRIHGEPGGNRTPNPQIKSLLLCQLSYRPTKNGLYLMRSAPLERTADHLRFTIRDRDSRRGIQPSATHESPIMHLERRWRARQDSNLRPTAPEAGALSS